MALRDIADISCKDSPETIMRSDRQYQSTISASYTEFADAGTYQALYDAYVAPNLMEGSGAPGKYHDGDDERGVWKSVHMSYGGSVPGICGHGGSV